MSAAYNKFFINGEWIEPEGRKTLEVVNPATEKAFATISMGNQEDVDRAAKAAKSAFSSWSNSSIETRKEIISKIIKENLSSNFDLTHFNLGPMAIANKNGIRNGTINLW